MQISKDFQLKIKETDKLNKMLTIYESIFIIILD